MSKFVAQRAIPTGQAWLNQIFGAQAVGNGNVVRRSRDDVLKYASHKALKKEVISRGFHLIRTGDQYVVLCHTGDLRVIC